MDEETELNILRNQATLEGGLLALEALIQELIKQHARETPDPKDTVSGFIDKLSALLEIVPDGTDHGSAVADGILSVRDTLETVALAEFSRGN